jgi:hypothetical protein
LSTSAQNEPAAAKPLQSKGASQVRCVRMQYWETDVIVQTWLFGQSMGPPQGMRRSTQAFSPAFSSQENPGGQS